ncbi:hypothetical protein FisN_16Hh043 [Fistulifera solaris]|jgi:hypothetical protein|uniref:HYR domain-containing protein n=1 Tax=Fistulifera solaris TaxID=1519565 RepID=A0A1Z5K6W5_FISSO|nr:hypothetical protein FisN_16Hh043 [Fistulifera solaris]|eukprot:GAX21966.1 hypothetical protein FisN_16Hh043 [Fistulifera solaris]
MKITTLATSLLLASVLAPNQASRVDEVLPHFRARSLLTAVELGNGAQLSVNINSPATGSSVVVDDACAASTSFDGSASVGKGTPDVTYIFVIDQSGSTSNIIAGIRTFFNELTDVVFSEGSALNAGVVRFSGSAVRLPALTSSITDIKAEINKAVAGGSTNCGDALLKARELAATSTAATTIVLFAGDGFCDSSNDAIAQANALAALTNTNVIIETIAINIGCAGDLGTNIPRNGGSCKAVTSVNDFDITTVIGTTLKNVAYNLNAGAFASLATSPSGDIAGPATKTFLQAIPINLGPNDLCVKATGSDEVGQQDVDVLECISIVGVDASAPTITCPANIVTATDAGVCESSVATGSATAVDNCSSGLSPQASASGPFPLGISTVTFSVVDASGNGASCDISVEIFDGEAPILSCPADMTVSTDAGICTATIEIPVATVTDNCDQGLTPSTTAVNPFALGSTTVEYTVADIAGNTDACTFAVVVEDNEVPTATCSPANNPGGNVPKANNQDGFFVLGGEDNCSVASYQVVDSGSGHTFGPFPSGTVFKYTEAPGATPSEKIGTGDVDYFLKGQGDAYVLVTDGSGNTATAPCLVPPKPSRLLRGI